MYLFIRQSSLRAGAQACLCNTTVVGSASRYAMPRKFGEKWATKCVTTMFPPPAIYEIQLEVKIELCKLEHNCHKYFYI